MGSDSILIELETSSLLGSTDFRVSYQYIFRKLKIKTLFLLKSLLLTQTTAFSLCVKCNRTLYKQVLKIDILAKKT